MQVRFIEHCFTYAMTPFFFFFLRRNISNDFDKSINEDASKVFAIFLEDDDYVRGIFTPKKHTQMHIHTLMKQNINKTF